MTILGRSVVTTTGYLGAPGYNILHWSGGLGPGPTDPDAVEEFHDTLYTTLLEYQEFYPSGVGVFISPDVAYFDDSDGVLLGVTTDPGTVRSFGGTSTLLNSSRATQLTVRFRTEEFISGRRLQGRCFIGPVTSDAIDNTGQVEADIVSAAASAWSGLISGLGGRLAVWHRPTTPSGTDGSYGDVTTVSLNSVPGTLRSRKT